MTLRVLDPQLGTSHVCAPGMRVVVGRAGSGSSPDMACDDRYVSRRHCELCLEDDGRLRVVDRSSYGTFINGEQIQGEAFAKAGDTIVLGHDYELLVEATVEEEAESIASASESNSPLGLIGERYQLSRELGRGGMGVVYLAHDRLRNAPCAVKLLLAGGKARPLLLERFRREAHLASRLGDHEGIVAVYDMGTSLESGELYCAQEYVDGQDLGERIRGGLPLVEGLGYLAQVSRAVAYAHAHEVVHRDLKPENVLVDAKGRARLTDFGIAKALDEAGGLTATGTTLGTPNYMPPEQIEDGKRVGPPADVYALGAILYHLLTGKTPFGGKKVSEVLERVKRGNLEPPRDVNPEIDPRLETICTRTMALDPARRPTAEAFAGALEAWLENGERLAQATLAPTEDDPLLGTRVAGKYELLSLLGTGASGRVYVARHLVSDQRLALKLISASAADPETRGRFLREVAACQAFVHKHAVQVRDYGQEEGLGLYLTMDLVEGEALDSRLSRLGRLHAAEVTTIGVQALAALSEAHQAGIVHRDLKPANMVLEQRSGAPWLRILDFGLAKAMSGASGVLGADLTAAGSTVGTLRFMSPEQACGDPLDGRSDLYSLATVLYLLLSGEHPLGDLSGPTSRAFKLLATRPPRPLEDLVPDVLPTLAAAIERNLGKSPTDRHPDAAAFARALRGEGKITAPPPARTRAEPERSESALTDSGWSTVDDEAHLTDSGQGTIDDEAPQTDSGLGTIDD